MTAPMGWSCAVCGRPFPHGRDLVEHLLARHPERAAVVIERATGHPDDYHPGREVQHRQDAR